MKIAVILFACLSLSSTALAASRSPEQIKAGIADAVERYANAISCGRVKVQPEQVLTLEAGKPDEALGKYAVLWAGDLGCWGGSGTEATHLAIATFNMGFVVQPELSSPVVAFESPVRFVTRVVSYSADTLILEGKAYGPNDPNGNPTIPVQFILRANAKGDWQLFNKTELKR